MMKPEQQRIAIAEACKWVFEKKPRCNMLSKIDAWHLISPEGKVRCWKEVLINTSNGPDSTYYPFEGKLVDYLEEASVPNYTEDLNAMHDAEKVLTEDQREQYLNSLYKVCNPDSMLNDAWNLNCATAAQRAEAFLRTIGKWEGE